MKSVDRDGRTIRVPAGKIHHWRGSVFIPGITLEDVLSRVRNPTSHDSSQGDVIQSRVLERRAGSTKVYLKLKRSKLVTVVYNTEHVIRYRYYGHTRAFSSSTATKIAELEHPDSPNEREKPEGRDRGFLWRLNSYWRYEQVDEGVIVECESVSLSRSAPAVLKYFIKPLINSVARGSMERTLGSMRDRLSSLAARGESPAAFDRRCIPADCVAPRSHTAGIFPRRALSAGRIASLGATRDLHHGLLGDRIDLAGSASSAS